MERSTLRPLAVSTLIAAAAWSMLMAGVPVVEYLAAAEFFQGDDALVSNPPPFHADSAPAL